jgi:DNA-binding XRE family transcriptional regulator
MPPKKTEFQLRMKALRDAVPANQDQFARALGVARPLVTQCEGGKNPSVGLLMKLGNFAADRQDYESAEWFWQRAGLNFQSMVQATLALLKHHEAPITRGLMTIVPPNKLLAQEREKDRLLYFPTYLLPDPLACSFIAVPDDSLRPLYNRRDVLIIDESETDVWKMVGSHIAAFRPTSWNKHVMAQKSRLSSEEFEQMLSLHASRLGIYAGWLRSSVRDGQTVLALESPNALGGTSSEVIAVQSGTRGRAEVPEFIVLGRIVNWIDTRGKTLPLQEETPKREDRRSKVNNRTRGREGKR